MINRRFAIAVNVALATFAFTACSTGTQTGTANPSLPDRQSTLQTRSRTPTAIDSNLILAPGFVATAIANVPGARELSVAPNGDLLVGTKSASVVLVADADSANPPGAPQTLVTLPEGPAAGIGISASWSHSLYVGTEHAVWKMAYTPGDRTAVNPHQIAALRTGAVAPGSDGDVHHTTSLRVEGYKIYVAVGSSCNACTEVDPGRAVILSMGLNGESAQVYAKGVRNAMALAVNPRTWFLWAGGAGQDNLPTGHAYEYFDSITQHPAGSSWGWPACEEKNVAYTPGADCSKTIVPHIEMPAYSTIMSAVFYPLAPTGAYAFPAGYRGGLFLTSHGSWHADAAGVPFDAPQVVFVPMDASGWNPQIAVDWNNPKAQYRPFFSGFAVSGTPNFRGRPTGIATGPQGSLFVGDDSTGTIYRIRPQ